MIKQVLAYTLPCLLSSPHRQRTDEIFFPNHAAQIAPSNESCARKMPPTAQHSVIHAIAVGKNLLP